MKRRSGGRDGCFTVIWICLITSIFLVFNGALVGGFYIWMSPEEPESRRLVQAILYLAPVLLIFPEWAIIDWVLDRLRPRRRA